MKKKVAQGINDFLLSDSTIHRISTRKTNMLSAEALGIGFGKYKEGASLIRLYQGPNILN